MEKLVRKKKNNKPTPISFFFDFKNKETETEIMNIISTHEGVHKKDIAAYLKLRHNSIKGKLFIEAKNDIQDFSIKYPMLALSDLKGLFDIAFMDMARNNFKRRDELMNFKKQ